MSKRRPAGARHPKPSVHSGRAHKAAEAGRGVLASRWPYLVGGLIGLVAIGWLAAQGFSNLSSAGATRSSQSPSAVSAIGAQAPLIVLPSTSGEQVSLDQYRGSKVVVYFYEGAG